MRRTLVPAAVAVGVTVAVLVAALVVTSGAGPKDPASPSASTELGALTRPGLAVPQDGVVETTSGPVRGVANASVRAWLGVPYAAAPTGRLRWRPPAQPRPWTRPRDVAELGASCIQPERYTFGEERLTQRSGTSEDCLFLNVLRPASDTVDLPVVLWLHGGGFFAGSGATAAVDGGALVGRGVVLVTVNYRLGRLGFFAHPSLEERVANFGLLDQVAALEWVRDNAAAFGGDPDNVTLAGGSAGAMSVNALMAMPRAAGLFHRAISQSAPSDASARTLGEARGRGAAAFPGLRPSQLRALPTRDLLDSTFNTLSGDAPIVDDVLPVASATAFADGSEADVPYLVGTTADEFSDDDYLSFGVDPDDLRDALGGARHDALVAAYGPQAYVADVLDDLVFDLPSIERAILHGSRAPTFRYVLSGSDYSGHGAEGAFVFDTVEGGRDGRLADAVADYWVAFARTGRPEVPGLPTWPQVGDGQTSAYLELAPRGPTPRRDDPGVKRLTLLKNSTS